MCSIRIYIQKRREGFVLNRKTKAVGSAAVAKKGMQYKRKKTIDLTLMALVPLLIMLCFKYVPLAGLQLAFKDFSYNLGIFGSDWVGLKNFKFLFASVDAWRITKNTIVLNLMFILTTTVGGIVFAIILNEIRSKIAIRFYQTCMFLPHILSASIVAYITFAFLNVDYGFINSLLVKFGGERVMWYSDPKYWYTILIIVNLWKGLGYSTIIYYANIISIDESYYEAAAVDGANWFQSRIKILIPMIVPMIITMFIMNIGKVFYADFGLFYMVPKDTGTLYPATDVIDTYVYRALVTDADVGKSAATGFYQSIVGFVLVLLTNALARKYDKNTAIF